MSEFFWDVQKIQEISNVEEHSVVKCVTVNTSRLISQLNEELQDEESGVNFIVTQLQLLINNVYEKIQKGPGVPAHRSLMVNLNFTRLKFSIAYWDILLERSLDLINGPSKTGARYFITEVTPVDRSRYVENNQYFLAFKANQRLTRNSVDMDEFIDFEILIKQIIFDLFKKNGIPDQDFEAILSRFHNLESLVVAFNE
ncbi:AEH_G0025160.mRNA.1.CDS.1 [Saccharomyces cerevisiae]|uniref:Spo16p n=1 Tax=Saccharomyces cerevisiae (strain JAY291) TaxID=574961 RepID=C7GJY5_YEAS2|nr:Spo16p [Saccharomyces cerevisiae JAY291]CAE6491912.1 Spo16p [Saccharomyces cerevisiae PE-2]CAF1579520.1 Spo16p [Saccharomyces cerevisiae PE-2]CAI4546849.1 AEH_G0025160.mRNA.1.CDS.1 [Saccharomyces cerevisiae]CAI6719696.1 AEH_G0025160.mRNA.1.CDS.1 [Saccharomyces cerevisiae]